MRNLSLALSALAILSSGVGVSLAAEKTGQTSTVQGELIDTQCYSTGQAKGQDHKGCAEKCAKSGIPVGVLSADGKVLTIATNPVPLAQYVAEQVRVTGEVNKDMNIIAPDKVEVQQDGKWTDIKLSDAHHGGGEEAK